MPARTSTRAAALLLAVALMTTACDGDGAVVDDVPASGGATASVTATDPSTPTSSAPGSATPAPGVTPAAPSSAPAAGAPDQPDTGSTAASSTPADDDGGVGGNGRAMLRPDRPTLVLEIDVQEGVSVDQAAVDHLVGVLGDVVDKPGGVVQQGGQTFADDRTQWTADDLRAASAQHRDTHTTDDQVSVHLLYVRGAHVQDGEQTNAIGLAFTASGAAVFPERWEGGVGALVGSGRAIERAVLVHELGHLFGLVNLTYTSDIDHEDPEHPGHSDSRDSVMFHAIESTLVGQVFSGPPPDTFDQADRSDLEGLRTGRL